MRLLLLPVLRLGILHREQSKPAVEVAPSPFNVSYVCPCLCPRNVPRRDVLRSWVSLYLNLLQSCVVVTSLFISGQVTPLSRRWNDMHLKHFWDDVLETGLLPSSITINFYISLKLRQLGASRVYLRAPVMSFSTLVPYIGYNTVVQCARRTTLRYPSASIPGSSTTVSTLHVYFLLSFVQRRSLTICYTP